MNTLKVAGIQTRSTTLISENTEMLDALVRDAAKQGAQYVQTPEMSGILQKSRRALFDEIKPQEDDSFIAHCGKLASELGIWLHIGSHAIRIGEEKAANRAFMFSPNGRIVVTYDKVHMFDVDLDNGESWRESKVYAPGESVPVIDLGDTRLGLSICYDLRFPHLFRQQAMAGCDILTVPAAFTRQTGQAHWHVLLRARAIENGAFVIAAAQGGKHQDGRETYGHSMIVGPWGEIIAELEHDEPGILVAELELDRVAKARNRIPNLANSRDFVLQGATSEAEAAQ